LYNRLPKSTQIDNIILEIDEQIDSETIVKQRQEQMNQLIDEQSKQKKQYDKHRRVVQYNEGEIVTYATTQLTTETTSNKLLPCFRGFFEIVGQSSTNPDEYQLVRLDARGKEKKFRTVHASQIKRVPELTLDPALKLIIPHRQTLVNPEDTISVQNSNNIESMLTEPNLDQVPNSITSTRETIRPNPVIETPLVETTAVQINPPLQPTRSGRIRSRPHWMKDYVTWVEA
jgi:hypothetical protein